MGDLPEVFDGASFHHEFNHVFFADVTVSRSVRNEGPFNCTDIPGAWFEFVYVRGYYPD